MGIVEYGEDKEKKRAPPTQTTNIYFTFLAKLSILFILFVFHKLSIAT